MTKPERLSCDDLDYGRQARFSFLTPEKNVKQSFAKQSFAMKSTTQHDPFRGSPVALGESKFEKVETGPFFGTSVFAHFGRRLQTVFPLPPDSSMPEEVHILLSEIQAKLKNFSGS
jgi:hypothetical protein